MVVATLSFITSAKRYETEKPYFLNILEHERLGTVLKTNLEYTPIHDIEIQDIRKTDRSAFTLKENGFQIMECETSPEIGDDGAGIEAYCNEIVQLLAKECDASHAICYDYRIRRSSGEVLNYDLGQDTGRSIAAPPVFPVHIDHTLEGGPKRIRRHLTQEEAEIYLSNKYRARIINVWQPLHHAVEDCPIAICHPSSIDPNDLIAADRVTPDFAVELYYLKHNKNQRWYWISEQMPNELTVFVNYDSKCRKDGPKWMTCPHAAFNNPDCKEGSLKRESIELRVVVFTPND
jgi:hypothetical protein